MQKPFNLKNLEADKIVLLGLFMLALLIAYLIVCVESAIVFSEPIELAHTGLSVSIPIGNGWQTKKQWQYQYNGYLLSSNLSINSNRPAASVYCQYLLYAEATPPEMWLKEKADAIDGKILESGRDEIRTLSVYWTHIAKPQLYLDIFLGTAELPNNRRLNIEVHNQMTSDLGLGEKVFKELLKRLDFEDNQLLKAGIDIVTSIKDKGINSFLENQNNQNYFLIKDSGQQTIGFMIGILIDSDRDAPFNIQAASHIYGRQLTEQATLFRCKNNIDEFVWQSESNNKAGRNHIEIVQNQGGIVEVTDALAQSRSRYSVSPATIPDIFLEQILYQMLESHKQEIIVDSVSAEGKIIPTLISIVEEQKDVAVGTNADVVARLEFLDGRGFNQTFYLNDNRQITAVTIQQEKRFSLESTSIENIESQFPDRADFIAQSNRMLGQEKL
jgi:hypothetical protein